MGGVLSPRRKGEAVIYTIIRRQCDRCGRIKEVEHKGLPGVVSWLDGFNGWNYHQLGNFNGREAQKDVLTLCPECDVVVFAEVRKAREHQAAAYKAWWDQHRASYPVVVVDTRQPWNDIHPFGEAPEGREIVR